jgi:hypothetical protein
LVRVGVGKRGTEVTRNQVEEGPVLPVQHLPRTHAERDHGGELCLTGGKHRQDQPALRRLQPRRARQTKLERACIEFFNPVVAQCAIQGCDGTRVHIRRDGTG